MKRLVLAVLFVFTVASVIVAAEAPPAEAAQSHTSRIGQSINCGSRYVKLKLYARSRWGVGSFRASSQWTRHYYNWGTYYIYSGNNTVTANGSWQWIQNSYTGRHSISGGALGHFSVSYWDEIDYGPQAYLTWTCY